MDELFESVTAWRFSMALHGDFTDLDKESLKNHFHLSRRENEAIAQGDFQVCEMLR